MAKPLVTELPPIANTPEMRCYLQRKFGLIGNTIAVKRETDILLLVRPDNMFLRIQRRLYCAVEAFKKEVEPQPVTLRLDISHLLPKKPPHWRISFIATS
jgi:hypothetical protein